MMLRAAELGCAAALGCALALAACSSPETAPQAPAPPITPAPAPAPDTKAAPEPASFPGLTTAHVLVVDAAGKPLAGMGPIVTRQPNAFDEPVSRGELTGEDGTGMVQAPSHERLYLRAWDPKLHFFAMNYFDLLPSEGGVTEQMTVQMLESGAFKVKALDANGSPVAGAELRAMLEHPKAGPWWPAQATTNAEGEAVFKPVPPGQYRIRLGAPGAEPMVLESLLLPPGEVADAGSVTLPRPK